MYKSFFIATLLFLMLSGHTTNLSMEVQKTLTINDIVTYQDIKTIIRNILIKEDQDDFRLVCKAWASKGHNWEFMPDSVEKEYDKIKKSKNKKLFPVILLSRTYKEDLKAVQWLLYSKKNIGPLIMKARLNDGDTCISAPMLAIHNNNRELAKILIEADEHYKGQNWKTCYKTITAPDYMQRYLYRSHDRDFSFIPYIIALMLDNADNLKQLYSQKIPATFGHGNLLFLLGEANASDCCDVLLENEITHNIAPTQGYMFFDNALKHNATEVIQKLIQHKIYNINDPISTNKTILDRYYYDDKYKDNKEAQIILENLGAKTWDSLEEDDMKYHHLCCHIQ